MGAVRWWKCSLVCLCTQPFLLQKHLQYKLISNNNIMNMVIEVPVVENNLIFMDDQKLFANYLYFVNVLFN